MGNPHWKMVLRWEIEMGHGERNQYLRWGRTKRGRAGAKSGEKDSPGKMDHRVGAENWTSEAGTGEGEEEG